MILPLCGVVCSSASSCTFVSFTHWDLPGKHKVESLKISELRFYSERQTLSMLVRANFTPLTIVWAIHSHLVYESRVILRVIEGFYFAFTQTKWNRMITNIIPYESTLHTSAIFWNGISAKIIHDRRLTDQHLPCRYHTPDNTIKNEQVSNLISFGFRI